MISEQSWGETLTLAEFIGEVQNYRAKVQCGTIGFKVIKIRRNRLMLKKNTNNDIDECDVDVIVVIFDSE